MKIKAIRINKLFGTFSYDIKLDGEPNPLIITGLNGYGKTTILTIINSLAQKDLFYFYNLPFNFIRIDFDNDHRIVIDTQKEKDTVSEYADINQDFNLSTSQTVSFRWYINDEMKSVMTLDKRSISSAIRRLGFYRRTELRNIDDTDSEEFYEFVRSNKFFYQYFKEKDECQFLFMMLDGFKTTFIEAQRILIEKKTDDSEKKFVSCVSHVSSKLESLLNRERWSYLSSSQIADRSIIETLLNDDTRFDETEYNRVKKEVELKLADLQSFNLIEKIQIEPYNEKHDHILTVYLKKLQEKIKVFDNILPKLQLFGKMIESLSFINKTVSYNPRKGIVIKSKDGKFLNIEKLSSGEKNEIIMLYYMIFEVADNTILLIDEPEISLHVAWQKDFIANLEEIALKKNLQVLVATHSPQIIGGRWNDCFDLCENLKDE